MRERVSSLLPLYSHDVAIGTFHSLCARLLRRYSSDTGVPEHFTIYDTQDQQALIKRILLDLHIDPKRYPPKNIAALMNHAKQQMQSPQDAFSSDSSPDVLFEVAKMYESKKEKAGTLDFGDLIYRLVQALEQSKALREKLAMHYQHCFVDEFQDTNHAQWRLVQALSSVHENLCVVGDDDQSIYAFRGADRRNMLDFKQVYPNATLIKLEQNYRSTKRILRAADALIARNQNRQDKTLWTENEEGPKILIKRCRDEVQEAHILVQALIELQSKGQSLNQMAILYRTHAQSRILEEVLLSAKMPYRVIGSLRFYERAEIKDCLAYLRIIEHPEDDLSLLRIINKPTRGLGKTTLDTLNKEAISKKLSVWNTLETIEELDTVRASAKKTTDYISFTCAGLAKAFKKHPSR